MDPNMEDIFNRILVMYVELSERYRYVCNKLVILEKMATLKGEIKAAQAPENSVTPPQNSVEVPKKKRGRPPKKPVEQVRSAFDSAKTDA